MRTFGMGKTLDNRSLTVTAQTEAGPVPSRDRKEAVSDAQDQ
jgi:hypothetical protein